MPSLSNARAPNTAVLATISVVVAAMFGRETLAQGPGVRVVAPAGPLVVAQPGQDAAADDPGATVEMFENPNLDRYLRRAQSFLERSDYTAAIEVLQDVIEGRTIEVVAAEPEPGDDASGTDAGGDTPKPTPGRTASGEQQEQRGPNLTELTARNSVFSHDGRLFRPVRRLCHELLSRMPAVGIEIYRTTYEFEAEQLFDEAVASGSLTGLENVANKYFVTLPAGRAMSLLADRLMHEGRYRGATQVLRDLLDIYPEENRRLLGIQDVWCRFKIALCLRLAGEGEAAAAAVQQLADSNPEESLRILGQLETIRDLPENKLFQRDVVAIDKRRSRTDGITWLAPQTSELVPLWEFRFEDPEPYKAPKANNSNRFNRAVGNGPSAMPFADRYGPATWVRIADDDVAGSSVPRALFLEHFRLRMADASSGLLMASTEASNIPPKAHEGHPRVRIAACDNALLRPVQDEQRRYVIIGYEGNSSSNTVLLKKSTLVAYGRDDWRTVWTSEDWMEGDDGLRDVTFLAAPTVFGERLLLPSLRNGSYALECIERTTGRPLWHAPLHAGGSEFFKAPGCPVLVQGGIAYVATNAGCLAAVDAFAGDLRWIRRYERDDPLHGRRRKKVTRSHNNNPFGGYGVQFSQEALKSFLPSDLILHDGKLIFAPVDGEMLLAIDAASGEPVWMLDGRTHYAPYGNLKLVIGNNDDCLFARSDSHVVCIELAGGLVRWSEPLPSFGDKHGRGRGAVVGDSVIVPGARELLVFDVANRAPMRRLPLPAFGQSRDPLEGSFNVVSQGPWLALGFEGGVQLFSTIPALVNVAEVTDDPMRRATLLTRAGDTAAAERVLGAAIRATDDEAVERRAGKQLLALVRQRAVELGRAGDLPAAMKVMDEASELMQQRDVRLNWHLARIEICKEVGDLRAHEAEQQRLYEFMEERG